MTRWLVAVVVAKERRAAVQGTAKGELTGLGRPETVPPVVAASAAAPPVVAAAAAVATKVVGTPAVNKVEVRPVAVVAGRCIAAQSHRRTARSA